LALLLCAATPFNLMQLGSANAPIGALNFVATPVD
jgi:hypothetical protein